VETPLRGIRITTIDLQSISKILIHFELSFNPLLWWVLLISLSVLSWSSFYMEGEGMKLFFSLLTSLFIVRMFLLRVGERKVIIFIGWEGLGITSYLLINWFKRWESINNGTFTYLTIRVGDGLYLLRIL
jgi:NADH:ubiquinone oxidoreductase subunit 5 (subunit L)/multisubunit Na+/H+ antiporter MnhA subunit